MQGFPRGLRSALLAGPRSLRQTGLRALDRLRLPGATVLPVAGAVVGLYGGLAAGRAEALARMDSADLDALPVVDPDRPVYPCGVVTRAGAQRLKRRVLASAGIGTMAPTEDF